MSRRRRSPLPRVRIVATGLCVALLVVGAGCTGGPAPAPDPSPATAGPPGTSSPGPSSPGPNSPGPSSAVPAPSVADRPEPQPPDLGPADYRSMQVALQRAVSTDPKLDRVRSVALSVDGRPVVAVYQQRRAGDHAHVWSITKSVLSLLVGVAVGDGLLRLDQTLPELLPDQAASMTPQQATITLRQLLTMTAGVAADDGGVNLDSDDPAGQILSYGSSADPGSAFLYSNGSAHLVATILQRAVDQPLLDYARAKLFDPLGIDTRPAWQGVDTSAKDSGFLRPGFGWATDHAGVNVGAFGLKLTTPDLLTLGQLVVDGGRWKGRQLVPREWVVAATSPQLTTEQSEAAGTQYGYFWWIFDYDGHPLVVAAGSYGQQIVFFPERRAVLAVTGDDDASSADDLSATLDPLLQKVVLGPILG